MKNIQALEPYITVLDAVTSSQWPATIVQMLRATSPILYYHSINVAIITAYLALFGNNEILEENGIPLYSLILGAFLHDVGYVGTASATACGKALQDMSYDEQRNFNRHIQNGIEQITSHTKDPIILDIVSMHHEYLDGTGFPAGKKNNEIPPHVRLVSIANAFSSYIENISDCSSDRSVNIISDLQNYVKNESTRGKFDLSMIDNFFNEIISYFNNLSPLHLTLHSFRE